MAFQFIHNGNRDPATRKLIRSHVMKGKNTGKTRLRSAHLEAGTGSHNLTSSSRSKPPAAYESPESVADKANFLTAPLGNTFSGFEFAWEVEPSMIELIHQCRSKKILLVLLAACLRP
jgi:hypothetical protein